MTRHYRVEKSLRVILLKSKVSPNSVIFERIRQQQCQQQFNFTQNFTPKKGIEDEDEDDDEDEYDDDDFEYISNAIVEARVHQPSI